MLVPCMHSPLIRHPSPPACKEGTPAHSHVSTYAHLSSSISSQHVVPSHISSLTEPPGQAAKTKPPPAWAPVGRHTSCAEWNGTTRRHELVQQYKICGISWARSSMPNTAAFYGHPGRTSHPSTLPPSLDTAEVSRKGWKMLIWRASFLCLFFPPWSSCLPRPSRPRV